MQAFSDMKTPDFVFDMDAIRHQLRQIADADTGRTAAPAQVRKHYREASRLLWIDQAGVDSRADTLVQRLHTVVEQGLSVQVYHLDAIERDLERLRTLDFEGERNGINQVTARLEYNLTKAFTRYAAGQRFGFVNPHQVFNRLDIQKQDSTGKVLRYRGLFDMAMDLPTNGYYDKLMAQVAHDSVGICLREVQPHGRYYEQLLKMLPTATGEERRRILCNMERSRWRLHQPIPEQGRFILVNIPAYHLYAHDTDSLLDMRVVCGNAETKTPQLTSSVQWMEVNPQWVIPMSIIENDVAKRAGDTAYFQRNRYHIYERATNKELPVTSVSRDMLLSGKYKVAQQGGAGNSLGRIIFRFPNNFSVFLHDTSNPGAFSRDQRAMSHGCVRVSKPFELARYVLGDEADEWLLDRMRISMDLTPQTERGQRYVRENADKLKKGEYHKLVGYVPVKPHVPLYIIYNTLWTDEMGVMRSWPDVYGYDKVIWDHLRYYVQ